MAETNATLAGHLAICRFDHWIKNVFVLPGVVLGVALGGGRISGVQLLFGLLAIGAVASSNYVLNEVLDAEHDRQHPVKRHRPVPEGLVSVPLAVIQWLGLGAAGILGAWSMSATLGGSLLALWIMGLVYNVPPVRTKEIAWLDVLSESVNNPLRLVAGWAMVDARGRPDVTLLVSYWLIGAFFMGLKRFAELRDLGGAAPAYRRSFAAYSADTLLASSVAYGCASVAVFSIFAWQRHAALLISLPFLIAFLGVYLRLAFKPHSAVQAPEKLWHQPLLVLLGVTTSALMVVLLLLGNGTLDALTE